MTRLWHTLVIVLVLSIATAAHAQKAANNGFEVVRIQTASNPKCINSKTDEVTLSVYRVILEKNGGFLVHDTGAGIAVIATLNGSSIQLGSGGSPAPGSNPQTVSAATPQVSTVQISGEKNGQIFVPLEYAIASRFVLSQNNSQTKTETTSMQLNMYAEKNRGANTFGTIVQDASTIIKALPIPANPYLTYADAFLNFATTSIQDDASNSKNATLFTSINIPFADTDYTDMQQCVNNSGSFTGAIAVLAATGTSGPNSLSLGNLSQKYCWRYESDNTFEIQYAPKPAAGCSNIDDSKWNEPSNDYTMLLLTAQKVPPSSSGGNAARLPSVNEWVEGLSNSAKLCNSLRVTTTLCGVDATR
jgi:hypothetical protein